MWQVIWGFWVAHLKLQTSPSWELAWCTAALCLVYCCSLLPLEIYFGCCSLTTFHWNRHKYLWGCPTLPLARLAPSSLPVPGGGADFTFQPWPWPRTLHWEAVSVLDMELVVSDQLCRVYLARQTVCYWGILSALLGELYVPFDNRESKGR